jgi:hypothetical protein
MPSFIISPWQGINSHEVGIGHQLCTCVSNIALAWVSRNFKWTNYVIKWKMWHLYARLSKPTWHAIFALVVMLALVRTCSFLCWFWHTSWCCQNKKKLNSYYYYYCLIIINEHIFNNLIINTLWDHLPHDNFNRLIFG